MRSWLRIARIFGRSRCCPSLGTPEEFSGGGQGSPARCCSVPPPGQRGGPRRSPVAMAMLAQPLCYSVHGASGLRNPCEAFGGSGTVGGWTGGTSQTPPPSPNQTPVTPSRTPPPFQRRVPRSPECGAGASVSPRTPMGRGGTQSVPHPPPATPTLSPAPLGAAGAPQKRGAGVVVT